MRTDENNNPAAFTVDLAIEAGLVVGKDYVPGTPFPAPSRLVTARLMGDPIATTIRLIDKVGYYTRHGEQRWAYIAIPAHIWSDLSLREKEYVIGFHYSREGGTAMQHMFPDNFPVDRGPSL